MYYLLVYSLGGAPGAAAGASAPTRDEEQAIADAHAAGLKELPETMRIMFKSGDDLRQDQLIMQLMQLMDGLLRKVGTWYLFIYNYLLIVVEMLFCIFTCL
jgi:hypothetical protein